MDIFISYAHVDNQPFQEGQKGWVDEFHRALQLRVLQWLGRSEHELKVWRDPKLAGNDVFADEILEQLEGVRLLVSVLSPRYVNSEWCNRELDAFCRAAERTGGMVVNGTKARVFKVVKMPIPEERMPPPLQPLLGYEFFRVDPASGHPRELHEMFGADARTAFWIQLDDLARDVAGLLESSRNGGAVGGPERPTVYLAATTRDLGEEHAAIRRELERNGFPVLPDRPLPTVACELEAVVRDALERASLAVIPVGRRYGVVAEGGTLSLVEVQDALVAERSDAGALTRLLWIPPGLVVEDDRQAAFVDRLRSGAGFDERTDLLETPIEELKTVIHERLRAIEQAARKPASSADPDRDAGLTTVYLVCDEQDRRGADAVADWLFDEGFEVVLPAFAGDEAEIREEHEERLRACDAVLLYHASGTDLWLSRKLRELEKIRGQGRTRPMRAQAILVAPPASGGAKVRTRVAQVIVQPDGFDAAGLEPFVRELRD
jgi:hypothetical protein